MKTLLTFLFLAFTINSFSQELNFGLESGTGYVDGQLNFFIVSSTIEYRPVKSLLSYNSGLQVVFINNSALITLPLTIKAIIGNRFRACPSFGGFIRNSKNYGWSAGLSLEYGVTDDLRILIKGDFNRDYWTGEGPSHQGGTYKYRDSENTLWFSIGFKKNIL